MTETHWQKTKITFSIIWYLIKIIAVLFAIIVVGLFSAALAVNIAGLLFMFFQI